LLTRVFVRKKFDASHQVCCTKKRGFVGPIWYGRKCDLLSVIQLLIRCVFDRENLARERKAEGESAERTMI
jgi:hypothetical protein